MPVTFWIFEGTSENFRKYHQKNKENGWKGKTTVVFTNVHLMYGIHFSVTQKGRHPTENHTSRTLPSQSTAKELSEICVQNFHFLLQNETTSPGHQQHPSSSELLNWNLWVVSGQRWVRGCNLKIKKPNNLLSQFIWSRFTFEFII